jgi:hypothetical protein
MRPLDRLHKLTDDGCPCCVGELGELFQVLIGRPARAGSLARRANEDCPFDGRLNRDELFADGILRLSS